MMHSQTFLLAAAAAIFSPASAAPLQKKDTVLPNGDLDILNYALTLEFLERKFYEEGVKNYSEWDFKLNGMDGSFYKNLNGILFDEQTHVSTLQSVLGTKAVSEATYAFPCTDAKCFVTLASVLEGVGVSAYLGAAASIIDKTYLTVAGSILTVEARHSSYLRSVLKEAPAPKPFDTPLDFNQVFSLAAEFITGFNPSDPALPFKPFPALAVSPAPDGGVVAGSTPLTFPMAFANAKSAGLIQGADTPVFAVFFSGLDTYFVPVTSKGDDFYLSAVPGADFAMKGQLAPAGQVYVVLSTADGVSTKVSDENTISGVVILEVVSEEDCDL